MKRLVLCAGICLIASLAFAVSKAPGGSLIGLARNGSPEQVVSAVKGGADVAERDATGATPLMSAARDNPNPEVIKVLIAAGANIEDRDGLGLTPLMWASAYNPSPLVVKALLASGSECHGQEQRRPNISYPERKQQPER